jgi:dephospho-CoA kinase
MKIVGLTGGIGSGKTTVSKVFFKLGVPVFYADDEAKKLYDDPEVISQVKNMFQPAVVVNEDGQINRAALAAIIFNNAAQRQALNELIHPRVAQRFYDWMALQQGSYCIREAAILIESGSYKDCNSIIVVTSRMEKRIERVMLRDGARRDEVEKRINAQITEEERLRYADFVIENNGDEADLMEQVLKIHHQLL